MDDVARGAAFVVGAAMFAATSISMVKTLIVPRRGWSLLTSTQTATVVRFFHAVARRMRNKDLADRFLGFLGPVAVVGMTVVLIVSYTVAVALMLFGFGEATLGGAFREAGSSVTTLGFKSTEAAGPTAIDVVAAISGLVVIALTIAYLPMLYAILRDRETTVRILASRIERPVTGDRVLVGHFEMEADGELRDLYRSWETWAAQVADTHSKYPILVHFRLPRAECRWLTGFLAALDAAALQLALDPSAPRGPAHLWLRAGEACIGELRHALRLEGVDPPPVAEPTREDLRQASTALVASGCPARPVDDEVLRQYRDARARYAPALNQVALAVMAPGEQGTR